jgi:transcription initiation factor TFIIIB Brf1 subunit/transcription initiation factor TFIIB
MEPVVIKCPHCGQLEQLVNPPEIDARIVCKRCAVETDYRLMRDEWIAALRQRVPS